MSHFESKKKKKKEGNRCDFINPIFKKLVRKVIEYLMRVFLT